MKGKYGNGPLPVDKLFQAIYQDREFFERHRITHVRCTFLYFTPCDPAGNAVIIHDQSGKAVDGYLSAGGYESAAAAYDHSSLVPQTLFRPSEH